MKKDPKAKPKSTEGEGGFSEPVMGCTAQPKHELPFVEDGAMRENPTTHTDYREDK